MQDQSFDFFPPIKEIAQERKLVEATIEKHLAQFVKLGILEINEFVSKEKTDLITDYFNKSNSTLLRDAKAALGEDISYAEIRYVLSHMKFLGTLRIIWANTFLFP